MTTKYSYHCPNQSYAITFEMCRARQQKENPRCRNCRNRACKTQDVVK